MRKFRLEYRVRPQSPLLGKKYDTLTSINLYLTIKLQNLNLKKLFSKAISLAKEIDAELLTIEEI